MLSFRNDYIFVGSVELVDLHGMYFRSCFFCFLSSIAEHGWRPSALECFGGVNQAFLTDGLPHGKVSSLISKHLLAACFYLHSSE